MKILHLCDENAIPFKKFLINNNDDTKRFYI